MIVIVLVVVVPVAVGWSLVKASQLRGPVSRPQSRRRVESLVTEAVPEERRDKDDIAECAAEFTTNSPPSKPGRGLRNPSER